MSFGGPPGSGWDQVPAPLSDERVQGRWSGLQTVSSWDAASPAQRGRRSPALGVVALLVSVAAGTALVLNGVAFAYSVLNGGLDGTDGFLPYLWVALAALPGAVLDAAVFPLAIPAVAMRRGRAWAATAMWLVPVGWAVGFAIGFVALLVLPAS